MDTIGGFDPPVVGLAVARSSLYFMNWGLQRSSNCMCHHPPLVVNLIFILFWQLHKLHFHTTMFHAFRKVDPSASRMFLEVVCRTRILIFKYKNKQDIIMLPLYFSRYKLYPNRTFNTTDATTFQYSGLLFGRGSPITVYVTSALPFYPLFVIFLFTLINL